MAQLPEYFTKTAAVAEKLEKKRELNSNAVGGAFWIGVVVALVATLGLVVTYFARHGVH